VIIPKAVDARIDNIKNNAFLFVDNPKKIFIEIANLCFPTKKKKGEIHPNSTINLQAVIDPTVYIGSNCVIGKCKIDEHTIIYANVVLNDGVIIGKNVIIYPGCVIGFDGFGYY